MPPTRGCLAAGCLGLWLLVGAPTLRASDVTFTHGGYVRTGNEDTLTMYDITNHSPTTSGTLRIELWALPSPYVAGAGGESVGYRLAVSSTLGQLAGYSSFSTDPITQSVFFDPPHYGSYYNTLIISEYTGVSTNDGFTLGDGVSDPHTTTFGAVSGADFGVTSAVQVGGGYFYDADLGYLYPFFIGWIYSYDLNQYFYLSEGSDFTTGAYIYDLSRASWTYSKQSLWPYVYYFDGTGWVDTGFN